MKLDKLQSFIINLLQSDLSPKLTYHGVHHTLDVLEACQKYVKRLKLSEHDAVLLQTAALFHDTGFLFTYEDHESESVAYAKKLLPNWGYSDADISAISGMIEATRIPQQPSTLNEKAIADADLDYLGTEKFYEISETLFHELLAFGRIKSREEWNNLQVKFLKSHSYHTDYAKERREPIKQIHLKALEEEII